MSTLNQNPYAAAPVNNCGFDPLSGFDFEVFVQDTFSGQRSFFGKFQSLTLSVRNATETYLELGQRIPKYLDGEIQIAWVLEQGLVDMQFISRTFGAKEITRCQFLTRGPRFHITFDANAAELTGAAEDIRYNSERNFSSGIGTSNEISGSRKERGRYEIQRCKVDSVSLGIMPGRRVAAVRWEGVAEGIKYFDVSLQEFKNTNFITREILVNDTNEPDVTQ